VVEITWWECHGRWWRWLLKPCIGGWDAVHKLTSDMTASGTGPTYAGLACSDSTEDLEWVDGVRSSKVGDNAEYRPSRGDPKLICVVALPPYTVTRLEARTTPWLPSRLFWSAHPPSSPDCKPTQFRQLRWRYAVQG
jgi:hypothetical protein